MALTFVPVSLFWHSYTGTHGGLVRTCLHTATPGIHWKPIGLSSLALNQRCTHHPFPLQSTSDSTRYSPPPTCGQSHTRGCNSKEGELRFLPLAGLSVHYTKCHSVGKQRASHQLTTVTWHLSTSFSMCHKACLRVKFTGGQSTRIYVKTDGVLSVCFLPTIILNSTSRYERSRTN